MRCNNHSLDHLPATLLAIERDALIQEITDAFAGVTREGGVSWSEAYAIDYQEEPDEFAKARERDKDTTWTELLENPEWNPSPGMGGWSFLDPIGFRYYLPAGMMRSIREGYNVGIAFHLTLAEDHLKNWHLQKWSLLDDRQRLCVRRFLEYMAKVDEEDGYIGYFGEWVAALNSYWNHAVPHSPQIIHSEAAHLQQLQDRAIRNLQISHIERPKTPD